LVSCVVEVSDSHLYFVRICLEVRSKCCVAAVESRRIAHSKRCRLSARRTASLPMRDLVDLEVRLARLISLCKVVVDAFIEGWVILLTHGGRRKRGFLIVGENRSVL